MQHTLSFRICSHPKFNAKFVGLIWHILCKSAASFGWKKLLIHSYVSTWSIMFKTISDKGMLTVDTKASLSVATVVCVNVFVYSQSAEISLFQRIYCAP